jgi:NAD(P)-dependent dehydrogenase (short-subunit alcohol dehydrogenase family)
METVEGKVAVVTGAAAGIGLALAQRFLADGASVVMADVDTGALDAAAGTLAGEHPGRVLAVPTDVRHEDEVDALAAATVERFGAAHVVCNNAGVLVDGLAWEVPADRWRAIVDVNLLGVANGVRAFVPAMIAQGEGHVVNTASAAGLITGPGMAPYYATKHGVVALSEALFFDLQVMGAPVGVSVLCPEWVRTGLVDRAADDGAEAPIRQLLAAAVATGTDPAEVAGAVVDAVREGRFWVLTHDTTLGYARQRWETIAAGGRPTLPDVAGG